MDVEEDYSVMSDGSDGDASDEEEVDEVEGGDN